MMTKWFLLCCVAMSISGLSGCAKADNNLDARPINSSKSTSTEKKCQLDNPSLQAMPLVAVSFERQDGSVFQVQARLANNNRTRAAGFQRVCASTIAAMPILFVFDSEVQPKFHMHNVVAPIDIAFIDSRGHIDSIQAMQPYSVVSIRKPLYAPKRPVLSAFEAHPGFFEKHQLSLESIFSWAKR